MFRFFHILYSIFLIHKGREGQKTVVEDISFSTIDNIFFLSFFVIGLFVGGLAYLAITSKSDIACILSVLFGLVLSLDMYLYIKIKKMVLAIIERGFRIGEEKIKRVRSRIIDTEELRNE